MVGFGFLEKNGVGKWLQIIVKFPGMLPEGEQRVGALLAVALCNSIFWVKALSFCLHYWPGASTQSYKNLKRLSLNFEVDQCKMEWGKIVYYWGKYSTVNNKEENAAEDSKWISIMPMIKDNVLGKGDFRRVSVLGWTAKIAVIVAAEPSLAWAWYLNYRAITQKWAWCSVWNAGPLRCPAAWGRLVLLEAWKLSVSLFSMTTWGL